MGNNTYLSLTIKNNTSATIPISILGNPSDLSDISNQTREFRWDITSLSFSTENSVSIDYRPNSLPDFTTYNTPLLFQSIQGVLDALNGLGIGSFFVFTSGGNTYISNYDNDYVFGDLNIYDDTASVVAWDVDCVGSGGFNDITTGFFYQNEANPFTGISYPTISTNGQQVDITGVTSNTGITKVKVYNQTTNTFIINDGIVGTGIAYSHTFNAFFGNNYLITVRDY